MLFIWDVNVLSWIVLFRLKIPVGVGDIFWKNKRPQITIVKNYDISSLLTFSCNITIKRK